MSAPSSNDSTAQTSNPQSVQIHDIQGTSQLSPLKDQAVTDVPGIVTAVRSNGFYLQDPNPDDQDATSEGIFVFTADRPAVKVGDAVQVNGVVGEFRPGNNDTNLTTTQIGGAGNSAAAFTVLSSGNPLPAAIVIGQGGRVPPNQVIENDTQGSVENSGNLFDPQQDGIDFYESLEGMRVQINHPVVVGPTNSFKETWVLPDNGADATGRNDRGGITISPDDFNPERIQIDDTLLGSGAKSPAANVGDKLDTVTGILDYSFNNFELLTTAPLRVTSENLPKEVTDLTGNANQLTIASFNVENLDPIVEDVNKVANRSRSNVDDDIGTGKFAGLANQIVSNLKSPDIIGLEEIQDNDGAEISDVVDASKTAQTLIDAIVAAGGPRYAYLDVPPDNGQDGGQPGGNIRPGILYNPDRVQFVAGSLKKLTDSDLSNGDAFKDSRKPLVGDFLFNGNKVTVIVNHFNSKGGDQPLFGPSQPPTLTSEAQRVQQAQIVNHYVDSLVAKDANANVVVLGDLNDFQFSNPLKTLEGKTDGNTDGNTDENAVLTDLAESLLPETENYTYNFQGNSQALDHILVSKNLATKNSQVDIVHINSEYAAQTSDHDPPVARLTLPVQTESGEIVTDPTFDGQVVLPTGFTPSGAAGEINGKSVPVGGLSGIAYDADKNQYYAISDDRSQIGPARFYTLDIDLSSGKLPENGVTVTNVTPLKDANGNFFALNSLDPEDIVQTEHGTVFISSEGEVNPAAGRVTDPFVNEFDLNTGKQVRSLPVPQKFLPVVNDTNGNDKVDDGDQQVSGVRNNLAFESLTITPDQQYLYTATENALFQDGPASTPTNGTRSRILQYNLKTGQPEQEFLYNVDPVAEAPNPADAFNTNGLVDLLALDDRGTLLALERSFSTGVPGTGNTIKIYEVSLQGATDISKIDSLSSLTPDQLAAIQPAQKTLLLNLNDLDLPTGTDNIEGLTFGPKLPDGRQSIVLVSDNNFSETQFTQVLALAVDPVPTANPPLEMQSHQSNDPPLLTDQHVDSDRPTIATQSGSSGKDSLYGGNSDDRLLGNGGEDVLVGGNGDDVLLGGDDADWLDGGLGNDTLRGGKGSDSLTGRAGSDVFVLAVGEGSDVISDFNPGEGDRLGLDKPLTFGQLAIDQGTGSNSSNTLIKVGKTGELLASLTDIQASTIKSAEFTVV